MLYGINQVPYTPEMNPIEQVWKEIQKRCFKNKAFQTLEAVIDKLQEVIQGLEKSVLKSTVNRQWARLLFENNLVLNRKSGRLSTRNIINIVNFNQTKKT
jgi:transposase, ISSpnII